MGSYKEIEGDLIKLTIEGQFDVVTHGANCQNMMGAGIAVSMKNSFNCDKFALEQSYYKGDYNKLGQIDWEVINRKTGELIKDWDSLITLHYGVIVVNSYTQYNGGKNLDYDALALCLKKINNTFKGKHIGLPLIGCGIAGGDFNEVKKLIKEHLYKCNVTVVKYKP